MILKPWIYRYMEFKRKIHKFSSIKLILMNTHFHMCVSIFAIFKLLSKSRMFINNIMDITFWIKRKKTCEYLYCNTFSHKKVIKWSDINNNDNKECICVTIMNLSFNSSFVMENWWLLNSIDRHIAINHSKVLII